MNKFTFVRHAQSQANLEGIIAGITDVKLTDEGILQAKEVAKILSTKQFDLIFCSPLTRAKQTAEEIIKYHKNTPFFIDNRLAERNYGIFEYKPYDEMNFDLQGKLFWDTKANVYIKDAQTFEEYLNQVKSFFDEINKKYDNKKILIITHGGIHRIITYLKETSHTNLISNHIQNTNYYDFEL